MAVGLTLVIAFSGFIPTMASGESISEDGYIANCPFIFDNKYID